jgi:hypothetical protein
MDLVTKRGQQGARFAVIRNYQPARIERELLAQVFEIVGRGSSHQVAVGTDGRIRGVLTTEPIEEDGTATTDTAETSCEPSIALDRAG